VLGTDNLSKTSGARRPSDADAVGVHRRRAYLSGSIEWLLVAASPLLAWAILRLAVMSRVGLPDPSIHTAYIVDPRQFFARYQAALAPTARLREGARVGFLVPARICYLLFGAVPGFVVFRYVLALIAVVPSYLLLKRLYGRPAGALAVVLILSCPVFILAWGTDYPDSAAVSYLIAAVACLGLALLSKRRLGLVAVSGALVTLAIWAFATSLVVGGIAVVAYVAVQWVRDRRIPWADVAGLLVSALVFTGLLALGSYFLLGQLDYVLPTWHAYEFLSRPSQEILWHSRNWHWVGYDPYLLVLPAVCAIAVVTLLPRWRDRRSLPLVPTWIAAVAVCEVVANAFLQFAGNVETLEMHFFSSVVWTSVYLALAVSIAEIAKALPDDWLSRWLPAAICVAVPLVYEAHGSVPAMKWRWTGIAIALCVVAAGVVGRLALAVSRRGLGGLVAGVVAIAGISGGLLVLTVAPPVAHKLLARTVSDPYPAYASTLGGRDAQAIDEYRIVTRLQHFTGEPSYRGEQLLIWWPSYEFSEMIEPMGIFHAGFNSVSGPWGSLSPAARREIESRKPGQILLMSYTELGLGSCLQALAPFGAHLVRRGVLSSGALHLHVWLIDLEQFIETVHTSAR
jgi:hypothetical protein